MSAGNPVVSVVMTSYADFLPQLRRAVDSIFCQTLEDLELVIAFEPGDANADALSQIYANEKLVVLKNAQRLGLAGSLNRCLEKARGRYIARMDSDDRASPDRLEKQIDFLRQHPDVAIVGSSITITDDNGVPIGIRRFGLDHRTIARNFALVNAMWHPTIVWDRRQVGEDLRYDQHRGHAEDLELWLRLLFHRHKFANLEEPLVEYRQPPQEWQRPIANWRSNLQVRVAHWRLIFRYPSLLIGLVAFAVLTALPKSVVNRLTRRNFFSDVLRSIQPSPTKQSLPRQIE